MKSRLLFILTIILLTSLLLVSCSSKEGLSPETTENETEKSEAENICYISLSEKLEWKPYLSEILKNILSTSSEAVMSALGAGLIDVNVDGVPEVAVAYPGGSAGNIFYDIIDLKTGKNAGSFNIGTRAGGVDGTLALYLDTETNMYMYVGESNYRGGWQSMSRVVHTFISDDGITYSEKTLFCEVYQYPDNMSAGTPTASSAEFFLGNTLVLHEDYFAKLEAFWDKLVKIENSDLVTVRFSLTENIADVSERAENIADSLINSTQLFVRGDTIK